MSCTLCKNCPPRGGECLNGFLREDSITCDVCPDDTTNIKNSCIACPDDPGLSSFVSVFTVLALVLVFWLLYAARNTYIGRVIDPTANLYNLIRIKQIGAALQVLSVFATISITLSFWFQLLVRVFTTISMPIQVQPVCTGWYEEMNRSGFYFGTAWLV